MKENKRLSCLGRLAIGLSLVFLALVAVALFVVNTPLAEPMTLVKDNAVEPLSAVAGESKVNNSAPKVQEVCGNTGTMLVLFTGEDYTKGVWPLGADTVRVVKFDFSNRKVVVVGFPRDLWVDTPGLVDQNLPETRIGLSYNYKKEATQGSDKHKITTATSQVAQALIDNFELEPEKYFTIQLQSVPEMIDTIGGVEVTIPEGFTNEYGVTIPAGTYEGENAMDGEMVAEYVRSWAEDSDEGDLLRFPRQNLLIQSLKEQVVSWDIIPKVPDLYKQFDKAIVTDLSPKQIADLACMAREVPRENVEFHEIVPPTLATEGEKFVLMPNVEAIKTALIDWLDL